MKKLKIQLDFVAKSHDRLKSNTIQYMKDAEKRYKHQLSLIGGNCFSHVESYEKSSPPFWSLQQLSKLTPIMKQ